MSKFRPLVALALLPALVYGARSFPNNTNVNYADQIGLRTLNSVPSDGDEPFTFAAWAYTNGTTSQHPAFVFGEGQAGNTYRGMFWHGGLGDTIAMVKQGASWATSSTTYTAGTWHHGVGIMTADNDRDAFIDGGSKQTNTTNTADSGTPDESYIGAWSNGVAGNDFDGEIGMVTVWDAALSDSEVAEIGVGRDPRTLATWPILHCDMLTTQTGNEIDSIGGLVFSEIADGVTAGNFPPLGF